MKNVKPHIKLSHRIDGVRRYRCSANDVNGYGDTPQIAYLEWKRSVRALEALERLQLNGQQTRSL